MLFSKPNNAVGVDIGTSSVKAVQMSRNGGRLRIDHVGYGPVDRSQFNVDPINAQASALSAALRHIPLKQSLVVGDLPGQTVVIRYPRIPEMPADRLAEAVETEAGQNIPYDLNEVYLDYTPLYTVTEGERRLLKVLLVAAKHDVIESRAQIADLANVQYSVLDVDSLALADAAECLGLLHENEEESVALVNLGANATSIHFVKNCVSNFIRDVNWGCKELVQAIARSRRCELVEAERMLLEAATEPEFVAAGAETAETPESVSEGTGAPEGASLLDPLDDELEGLGELDERGAAGEKKEEKPIAELLTQPMHRLVSEIRRSFDYYEQQLYEHPVSRIILSGGVAHLPVLRDTLAEDLGVEQVEVADPASGELALSNSSSINLLREHPAQFMVAVGLAARGVAAL